MRLLCLTLVAGCVWISPDERVALFDGLEIGLSHVDGPEAVRVCDLPGTLDLTVGFAKDLSGRSVSIATRFDPEQELTQVGATTIEPNDAGLLQRLLRVPIPASCAQGCDTLEVIARFDHPEFPKEESIEVPVTVLPETVAVSEAMLDGAAGEIPLADVVPSTLHPVGAVNLDDRHILELTITEPAWDTASASLTATVVACPEGETPGAPTCVPLDTDALDTEGSARRHTADLTALNTCDDLGAPGYQLFVTYQDTGCQRPAFALPLAPVRFVFSDCDGDGFDGAAWATVDPDCDDAEPTTNPQQPDDTCDGVDNDCNTMNDDGVEWYADEDGDGYGVGTLPTGPICPQPADTSPNPGDCDDAEPLAYPGRSEAACDGIDNDCDPASPDDGAGLEYHPDDDGDTYGDPDVSLWTECPPQGWVEDDQDCAPSDPTRPWSPWADADGDGFGDPAIQLAFGCNASGVDNGDDCDDGDPAIGGPLDTWPDIDEDLLGAPAVPIALCPDDIPTDRVTNALDCDDTPGNDLGLQATEGLVIADGTTFVGAAIPWSSLDDYSVVELCAPLSGELAAAEVRVDAVGSLTLRSGSGQAVRLVPAGNHRLIEQDEDLSTLTLDHLVLANGFATGDDGGCVLSRNGDLIVTDTSLEGCTTDTNGGALAGRGSVFLERVTIQASTATLNGGAVSMANGDLTINDSTLDGNSGARGGAISCASCSLLMDGTTIRDHTSIENGGAVRVAGDSSVSVSGSTFSGNTSAGTGGALSVVGSDFLPDAEVIILDSVFEDNEAGGPGGHIYAEYAELTIDSTRFARGTASNGASIATRDVSVFTLSASTLTDGVATAGNGGAIDIGHPGTGSTLLELPCPGCLPGDPAAVTFARNLAQRGGAINVAPGASVLVEGATFDRNEASQGGALSFEQSHTSAIRSSWFWRNTASTGSVIRTGAGDAAEPATLSLEACEIEVDPADPGNATFWINQGVDSHTVLNWTELTMTDPGNAEPDVVFESDQGQDFLMGDAGTCSQTAASAGCPP